MALQVSVRTQKAQVATMVAVQLLKAFGYRDAEFGRNARGTYVRATVGMRVEYWNTLGQVKAFLRRANGARV